MNAGAQRKDVYAYERPVVQRRRVAYIRDLRQPTQQILVDPIV